MRLTSLSATGYRSLRSIRLDIGQLALFVGEIVTHSRALADEISARTGVHAMIVVRRDGATSIEGMGLDGRFGDE